MSINEIEKMYENAGVELVTDVKFPTKDVNYNVSYPPFTAEQQIKLIKWLLQNKRLCIRKAEYSNNFYMDTLSSRLDGVDNKDFEQCLASLVNRIWQNLTEEEKEQVRSVLK